MGRETCLGLMAIYGVTTDFLSALPRAIAKSATVPSGHVPAPFPMRAWTIKIQTPAELATVLPGPRNPNRLWLESWLNRAGRSQIGDHGMSQGSPVKLCLLCWQGSQGRRLGAYASDAHRVRAIPTGLWPKAQGWRSSAYLGYIPCTNHNRNAVAEDETRGGDMAMHA